jgi:hypothetical protein
VLQGNPYLEEMKATAKYIAKRGKGILARWVVLLADAVCCATHAGNHVHL